LHLFVQPACSKNKENNAYFPPFERIVLMVLANKMPFWPHFGPGILVCKVVFRQNGGFFRFRLKGTGFAIVLTKP